MTETRTLRYVLTLARHLSYTRAAEELGITQPALTRSIQQYEGNLGMRLFDRDRAGVRLTVQGQALVERARPLLADIDDFDRSSRRIATGEEGRIRFGMAPLPAAALLPSALQERISEAPFFLNEVLVRNVDALWPLLIGGDIEFFVSAEEQIPASPPVRAEVLGTFPITLLVRSGHPLLKTSQRLGRFPLLLPAGSERALKFPSALGTLGEGPVHLVEDFGSAIAITKATDAIWISSAYAVVDELHSGALHSLPDIHPAQRLKHRMLLYSMDRRSYSPATAALKASFRKAISQLGEAVIKA